MTGITFSASECPVHCEDFWVWQRIYGLLGDHLNGEKLCRAQLYWPLGLGTVLSSAPLTHLGSSFSLVSLTLCKAGWWYSALEFSKLSAVELAISIPSVTWRSRDFLKVCSDLNLNDSTSPVFSGWNISRCLWNALDLSLLLIASTCWLVLTCAEWPDSPQ